MGFIMQLCTVKCSKSDMMGEKTSMYQITTMYQNHKATHCYVPSTVSNQLVVLFPGFGYDDQRPLLAQTKKLALQNHASLLVISYGELNFDKQQLNESVQYAYPQAYAHCSQVLHFVHAQGRECYFVSKSFGTILAGSFRDHAVVKQCFLTPLKQTLPYIRREDLICIGTNDSFICEATISDFQTACDHVVVFPNANHSLLVADDEVLSQQYFHLCRYFLAEFLSK